MELVETICSMLGLPLLLKNGRRAFGGHASRVGGARHLARIGIPIATIALLGRWGSEVILAYIMDAPLELLTAVYKDLAASASSREARTRRSHTNKVS